MAAVAFAGITADYARRARAVMGYIRDVGGRHTLMAAAIHNAWHNHDRALALIPGPLADV